MTSEKNSKPRGAEADAPYVVRQGAETCPPRELSGTEALDLLALGSDWLWETDADLRFSWLSEEFEPITGVSPGDVLGRMRFDFLVQVSRGSKSAAAHLETLQARKPFRNFVYRLKGSRDNSRWISVSGSPRFDADGTFMGYRGVGHNVTSLAASFEELQKLHGQLARTEERDKVLNDERAGESHA